MPEPVPLPARWLGRTLPWLLPFLGSAAWAGTPLLLPATESPAAWEVPARMAGFSLVTASQPGVVMVVPNGAYWEIRVQDPSGAERRVRVAAPTTPGEREDLLWVAASLATPLEPGALSAPALIVPPRERAPTPENPPLRTVKEPKAQEAPPALEPPPWRPDDSPWLIPPPALPVGATSVRAELVVASPLPRAAPPPPTPIAPPPVLAAPPRVGPWFALSGAVVSTASMLPNAATPQLSVRGGAQAGVRLDNRATIAVEGLAHTAAPMQLADQTALLSRQELALVASLAADSAWQPGVGVRCGGSRLRLHEGTPEGITHDLLVPTAGMRLSLGHEVGGDVGLLLGAGLDADMLNVWVEQSAEASPVDLPTIRGVFEVAITWTP